MTASKRTYWLAIALVALSLVFSASASAQIDDFKNGAVATVLAPGYDASATTIVVTAGHGTRFPTPPFQAAWTNATDYPRAWDDPNFEVVTVTAVSTDTLTITRAQEGTAAATHNTTGKTYQLDATLTALTLTRIKNGLPLSVKNFGAISGDGVDDAPAFQRAIDYALGPTGTCQAIYVPAGQYRIETQLNFYDVTTPGPKDCGRIYGDSGGNITLGSELQWYGPYWQSVIRMVGGQQRVDHLNFTAYDDWIAAIDYSGSDGIFIGTVDVSGRSTNASIEDIFINCQQFHGDGIDIGRFGFQSDQLYVAQVSIKQCIHGKGIASFISNTQSLKIIGGEVSHAHIGIYKAATTNLTMTGLELDNNDVNFVSGGGGTFDITGGRSEESKRMYYDTPGTTVGPVNFIGFHLSNLYSTPLPAVTVTTYSTLADPAAPTVVATGGGSTTWGYKVVCYDANGINNMPLFSGGTVATNGHTNPSAETTIANGAATLSASAYNTITFTPSPGSSFCNVWRTTAGTSPSTTGAIALVPNNQAASVIDIGYEANGVAPTASNNTTPTLLLSVASFVEGDRVAIDGAGSVAAGGVLSTTITACYDLTHCHPDTTPTADVVAQEIVLYGESCTASTTNASSTITLTTPCVTGNALITLPGAGVAGAPLRTTLTAATCTFTGSPHNMECASSVTAGATLSGVAVKSPTNIYWQNIFSEQKNGPYVHIGNNFAPVSKVQFIQASNTKNQAWYSNNWRDTTLYDPLGRVSPTCVHTSIGNTYSGTSALAMPVCLNGAAVPTQYKNTAAFTAIASTASETYFAIAANGQILANALNGTTRRLDLTLAGVYGTNGAGDSVTIAIKMCTVSACGSGTTTTIATTAAITPGAGVTGQAWNIKLTCNVFAVASQGTAGTLDCQGNPGSHFFTTAATVVQGAIASTSPATIDYTVDQFLSASATWNNSSANNTITLRNFVATLY